MKRTVLLITLLLSLSGCAYVGTGQHTTEDVNGDAWYVKTKGIGMLVFKTEVYYCPAPSSGQAVCTQAKVVEEPAPAYAPPPAYGQPAQPATGVPAYQDPNASSGVPMYQDPNAPAALPPGGAPAQPQPGY